MDTLDILWIIGKICYIIGLGGLVYALINIWKANDHLDKAQYHLNIARNAIKDNMSSYSSLRDSLLGRKEERSPTETFEVGGYKMDGNAEVNDNMSESQKEFILNDNELVNRARQFLKDNNINSDKVRFVNTPHFVYDSDTDEINPKQHFHRIYDNIHSMNLKVVDENGQSKLIKKEYKSFSVRDYENVDWNDLRNKINNSKLGYVFMLEKREYIDFSKSSKDDATKLAHTELDTDIVRYVEIT